MRNNTLRAMQEMQLASAFYQREKDKFSRRRVATIRRVDYLRSMFGRLRRY